MVPIDPSTIPTTITQHTIPHRLSSETTGIQEGNFSLCIAYCNINVFLAFYRYTCDSVELLLFIINSNMSVII